MVRYKPNMLNIERKVMDIKDLYNNAFDYYKVYLKQRTDSFNFFLVLAGFLVSATAIVLTKIAELEILNISLLVISILLSIIISIISFLFSKLDNRTMRFIRKAEDILVSYEKEITLKNEKLFIETDKIRKNGDKITMGRVFKSIYIGFTILGIIEFIATIIFAII